MRLLLISAEYPPVTDGIGTYVASLAPALVALGHEVHVLSCRAGQAAEDVEDRGVRLHRRGLLALPAPARLAPVSDRLRAAASAALEARRLGRFDAIEAPDWLAEGLGPALWRRTALVVHLHTPIGLITRSSGLPERRAVRAADALERLACRRADLLTAPSRLLVEALERDGWLRPRPWYRHPPVRVIPYPIDPAPWAGLPGAEAAPPVVLAIGRLERRKAPEVLLAACASLAREGAAVELVLAGRSQSAYGSPSSSSSLRREAEREGLVLRLTDRVPHHELPALLGGARVVALASRFDNFPMAGLEGLAAGRPVVCTTRTGTADLLAGTDAGAVVAPDDPAALAAALRPYLADRAAAGRAGAAARALVERECSPAAVAGRREAVYREAAARRAA